MLIVIFLVWTIVAGMHLVSAQFLPGPGTVWKAFWNANSCVPVAEGALRKVCGVQNYYLWEHLVASLQRMAVGVGAALIAGTIIGFAMAASKWTTLALAPYLNFIRALPPLGYIGLIIVWVGIGDAAKYWLLFLAAFPPIVLATMNGVRDVSADRIQAAQSMGASRWQSIRFVILPASLNSIVSGVRLAVGFAWTTVVAAELNNGIPGIGGIAYLAGTQLNTALVIACVVLIGVVAVLLDALIAKLGDLLTPWHGKA
ncbi:ABC transporter permease [Brachybacterium kimchii]|uniref:ABC transporter permease n=1 Tax=Brachybacterium kimchii TaxID=2942909 RepID=A0ABY4N0K9_9MICO|nr:ABC transporter permease [Brachybacterium kimchii]UQN28095.1 ABC transporter permease [Brachybacterium kimchii]